MKKKNKVNLKKVIKAKGGADASKADFGAPSGNTGNKGSDHSHSRFDVGSGYYGEKRGAVGGKGDTKTNRPPNNPNDVAFKKPLGTAQSLLLGAIVPFSGTAINLAAKHNYKNRQKFARKEGLYRDFYKTQGYSLQPNSPVGKSYLKDAGYGKRPDTKPDKDGPPIKPTPSLTAAAKPVIARGPVMPYYMGFDFQNMKKKNENNYKFKSGGLSGGKRFGPPPKKGPNSHGKCPFRPDGIRGVGAVQKGRGVKFVGVK